MIDSGGLRVGIYVDVENATRNGGRGMRFDVLRDFACRGGGVPIRLNAYLAYDEDRARLDADYRDRAASFQSAFRDYGFKVFQKKVQWYVDEEGRRISKANVDLDMAVDMLLQSERLDRVVLVSGDGDFAQVVRALQNRGCRVEIVAFQNVSKVLRQEGDYFLSGYLVPGLLPVLPASSEGRSWGESGARVRGVCYHYDTVKKYGFVRYLKTIDGNLLATDTRSRDSAYGSAFFHVSALPSDFDTRPLPSREVILEFTLGAGRSNGELAATDVRIAYLYGGHPPSPAAPPPPGSPPPAVTPAAIPPA